MMGRDYGTKFEEYFLCMYPTKTCEELLTSAGNKTAVWHTAQSDAMECAVVDASMHANTEEHVRVHTVEEADSLL